MEKSLTYKSMFSELSRLVYAFSNGKFYRYLLDNAGLKIRMRWPKRTCIVIGTVDSWPLCAPSYEAICNICKYTLSFSVMHVIHYTHLHINTCLIFF
ncbi:IE-B [Suid betaherpesvirus 2]|uniref:IE-B n=1 Tax=Suid betaherpesvirus 2 TaxID=1608255 RepID=U3GQ02_9BETA|nr:IE-B [Suid betaherpesvirus 2]AGT99215.1 IE-B [Suid betaherpesvirus 2]